MARNFAISDDVRAVLARCTIDAASLKLPQQLPRDLYVQVDKVLKAAGGKWNRKAGVHLFDRDPSDALGLAVETGQAVNVKQLLQAFYTPADLARSVVDRADIRPGHRVLEPSAGMGSLADTIRALLKSSHPRISIDCIDNDPVACAHLLSRGYTVAERDFLTVVPDAIYDRVVMNPPFSGGQDIAHVTHALGFLKPGGRLVAITSPSWQRSSNRNAAAFRELVLDQLRGDLQDVEAGTFKDSGTDVRTVLLIIDKPAAVTDTPRARQCVCCGKPEAARRRFAAQSVEPRCETCVRKIHAGKITINGNPVPRRAIATVVPGATFAALSPRNEPMPSPPKKPRRPTIAELVEQHFPTDPAGEAFVRRLQAKWDAEPHPEDPHGFARPVDPGVGDACLAWRKAFVRGATTIQPAIPRMPSIAAKLKPIVSWWRKERSATPLYGKAGAQIGVLLSSRWVPDASRATPARVRCPQCQRPIRLARWWEHGCPKAITATGEALGDFHEVTKGARAPGDEDDVATTPSIEEVFPADPVPPAPAREAPAAPRGHAKLTPEKASELRRRALAGENAKDLAREFGIRLGYVYTIKAGRGRTRWDERAAA